ncbi:MAG: caspase family protein [Aureispira sp.]
MYRILLISSLFCFLNVMAAFGQDKGCVEGNCENGWGVNNYYIGKTYQGRYEGNFLNGKRDGKGKFAYANGAIYDGSWKEGKPNGLGARVFKDGKIESGVWEAGRLVKRQKDKSVLNCLVGNCKEGYGKSKDKKGNVYTGNFEKGQYSGYGEMRYQNGDRYQGHWKNSVLEGKGSYYFNNGHVNTGAFAEGKFLHNKMKIWAVVVGIADYAKAPKLNYTTRDAQRVYAFLRSVGGGAVPEDQIKLLLDEEATAFNIMNTAADLYEQADSNDLIIFYFAGHGKSGAFLPFDYDGTSARLLHHGLVNSLLKDSPAKYKLCAVDACHSGSFDINTVISYKEYIERQRSQPESLDGAIGMTRSTKNIRDRIKNYYKSFDGVRGGIAVIMSSASEEISLEANKLQQGVFSYYFIQAMKGAANKADENGSKDNVIDVQELYQFIEKNVRNFTYGFQHPLIYGNYDEHMPVGLLKARP